MSSFDKDERFVIFRNSITEKMIKDNPSSVYESQFFIAMLWNGLSERWNRLSEREKDNLIKLINDEEDELLKK